MAIFFVLISQTLNLTPHRIGFRVRYGRCPVPNLEPHQSGIIKQHRILRYCRNHGPDWTISVFSAGEYTGIELTSKDLLIYTRLIFRYVRNDKGRNVLQVEGVLENRNDYLWRHWYFGFLRNVIWNRRRPVLIGREDSQVATKLRMLESPPDQQATPLAPPPAHHGPRVNHGKQNSDHVTTKVMKKVAMSKHSVRIRTRTKEQRIPVPDSLLSLPRSSTSKKVHNHIDRSVHGILFLVAFMIVFLVRAVMGLYIPKFLC